MTFLVGAIIVISIVSVASNPKLKARILGWFGRKTDNIADNFGTIVDDRQQKIKAGRVNEKDLKNERVKVLAQIKSLERQVESEQEDATKYLNLAKVAKEKENTEAALEYLRKVELAEHKIKSLENTLSQARQINIKLQAELRKLDDKLDVAEVEQDLFAAQYKSAEIQKSLSEKGVGGVNFDDEDKALKSIDDEINAYNEVFNEVDATTEFEQTLEQTALTERLQNL